MRSWSADFRVALTHSKGGGGGEPGGGKGGNGGKLGGGIDGGFGGDGGGGSIGGDGQTIDSSEGTHSSPSSPSVQRFTMPCLSRR